jgi:hypothetical protein
MSASSCFNVFHFSGSFLNQQARQSKLAKRKPQHPTKLHKPGKLGFQNKSNIPEGVHFRAIPNTYRNMSQTQAFTQDDVESSPRVTHLPQTQQAPWYISQDCDELLPSSTAELSHSHSQEPSLSLARGFTESQHSQSPQHSPANTQHQHSSSSQGPYTPMASFDYGSCHSSSTADSMDQVGADEPAPEDNCHDDEAATSQVYESDVHRGQSIPSQQLNVVVKEDTDNEEEAVEEEEEEVEVEEEVPKLCKFSIRWVYASRQ